MKSLFQVAKISGFGLGLLLLGLGPLFAAGLGLDGGMAAAADPDAAVIGVLPEDVASAAPAFFEVLRTNDRDLVRHSIQILQDTKSYTNAHFEAMRAPVAASHGDNPLHFAVRNEIGRAHV